MRGIGFFCILIIMFGTASISIVSNKMPLIGNNPLTGDMVNGVRIIPVEACGDGFKPNQIIVKQGEKIRLVAKTVDIARGILIQDFKIYEYLDPQNTKAIDFIADKPGEYKMYSSFYCGPRKDYKTGKLIVKPSDTKIAYIAD